ncbi:putative ubiquitinyl hydrolase 1 transcription factor C2H2 family [Helianthus annuus]|nr:putative ubiquitinyl hydrolase 1 transcription factor C2H2 family [Helianthus annuus]
MQCNYCSNKFDPFLDLSLEILRADTIYKAFANFTAKEQLDGGAKQYQCQQCKQKVKALKQLTIHKPPNVLTVHLKRFGSHVSGQKIDKKIQFGPTLDLKPFVTGPYDGDLKYTLYGVLVHAGWSTHSGHYYCFVRTSSGMWYSLDDNRVRCRLVLINIETINWSILLFLFTLLFKQVYQVSEKKVFEQKAYMLFYFKDRKNIPTKKTTDVHHKDKIVMNGPLNGSGAAREAQMKTGLSNGSSLVAPKEISTNTVLSNVSINGHTSSVPVSTQNGSGARKEAEVKTGLSDGSLNAETALVTGNGRNGFTAVAPKRTQTDSGLCNGSLNGQKSSAAAETVSNGFSTVATEATQKKQASVPESISEPSKTEDHMKVKNLIEMGETTRFVRVLG